MTAPESAPAPAQAATQAPPVQAPARDATGDAATASTAVDASAALAGAPGADLIDPPEIRAVHGVLATTFVVAPATVTVAGRTFTANVYDGRYIPPVLRVAPGDTVRLRLVNRTDSADVGLHAPEATNLHYHGLALPPGLPADDIFYLVPPAGGYNPTAEHHGAGSLHRRETHGDPSYLDYLWTVPADHPRGLHWYHPHPHGNTENQLLGGMSGGLVVEGLLESHYPELVGIRERLLLVKDIELPGAPDGAPKTKTINGQTNPTIRIRPGELQLWRVGNIGADAYANIALDGHAFRELTRDGNPRERPLRSDSLFLPPSSRRDVVVAGGAPGTYLLRSRAIDTGPQGDANPAVVLATVVVAGAPVDNRLMRERLQRLPVRLAGIRATVDRVRTQPIARRRTLVFSETADGNTFFIDGQTFDPGRIDAVVRLGDAEEWTLLNNSDEVHVFHIHQTDFLVTEVNGVPQPAHGLQDTAELPYRRDGRPGEVRIVIPFDNPLMVGKFVYHCHILEHEDHGMMGSVVVLPR